MRRSWLLVPLSVGVACGGSDEDRPPEFQPDASLSQPRTCDEVRQGQVKEDTVWVEGEPAACGATGMECPVFDVATFADVCAVGMPLAGCVNGKWLVRCELDAGVWDAAPSDGSE